ncbi:type II toxin-antitoxin system RelE/ParE family toxin [Roseateles saccharophilus]|uniref:Addiction module RelE/StbE family toxin n=1 Tax=Roseateles saccharophilus TaxID=304 RepID=A0A4R3U7C1_ROSSA|nr:type II toxin-antitoxin system RelE/ParE family toxin [Roseateles saccharophilus]MDG0835796.1 type II toxin-antitoxin system RelE/ParE family toxin [Roseateles saccharophilus]TCU83747.1 addiction module RelE/StbE family toxin [Roseateles saccharophilus]
MRLEWRPMALEDRGAIMEFIGQDNPAAALQLDEDFEAKAEQACRSPTLYKPGRMKGTREIVVRPSYVMVYQVEADAVVVVRVLHAAQQWPVAAKP